MRFNSTLVGLVVLALVTTGVFWVRSRPPSPSAGHLPAASARQAPSVSAPASTVQDARAYPSGDDALPDVTLAEGSVDLEDVRITLSLSPHPPVAFAKMRVRVRAEVGGAPVALEGGKVWFEMTMPMGDHRYSLAPGADGWQEAAVVLPT